MIIITDTGGERVHITAPTERHSTGEVLLRLVNSASKQAVEVTLDVQEGTFALQLSLSPHVLERVPTQAVSANARSATVTVPSTLSV